MTDYIENMMKTAGVVLLKTIVYPTRIDMYKETNSKTIYSFPNFTSAKQLEIIKLIVDKCHTLDIFKGFSKDSAYNIGAIEEWSEYKYKSEKQDFPQALAQLTTELMKAGELDKSKVKEILCH